MTLDASGNIYGTTTGGGSLYAGVIYKLDKFGHETVLYTLGNGYPKGTGDGAVPFAPVTLDSVGNLCGTTSIGGANNAGVVYKLDTAGNFTQLNSFASAGSDQGFPNSGVVLDAADNVYGTIANGGTATCFVYGCGAVYQATPAGQETLLYSFPGGTGGEGPPAGVVLDVLGNLYGTTSSGGAANPGWCLN